MSSAKCIKQCLDFKILWDELGRTIQTAETGKSQQILEDIEKYGEVTANEMERKARLQGLLKMVASTSGNKRMEFMNRGCNAAIHIRKSAMLETRPPASTRANFVGQPLKVELYEKKMESVVGGRSGKTRRRLQVSWRRVV
jgi:hypothetical protein